MIHLLVASASLKFFISDDGIIVRGVVWCSSNEGGHVIHSGDFCQSSEDSFFIHRVC